MTMVMTTKEAIQHVLDETGMSPYALAKEMEMHSNMVKNYLDGTRMRKKMAQKFEELYNIKISDVFDPTADARARHKNDNTKRVSRKSK